MKTEDPPRWGKRDGPWKLKPPAAEASSGEPAPDRAVPFAPAKTGRDETLGEFFMELKETEERRLLPGVVLLSR
jgi:hypothetical protein